MEITNHATTTLNFFKTLTGLTLLLLLLAPLPAHAAKMGLSPGTAEFKSGCTNYISIIVNTEGENTMAADAFLVYNKNEIDIIDLLPSESGTQLKPGPIYDSYPGNYADNGYIRLTAFNKNGFYNGRGTLAALAIKNKPGIKKTNIYFDFTPGGTKDSNVAGPDSADILNAAYGGTYTFFEDGPCYKDITPPVISERIPNDGAMLVPLDSEITFSISDDQAGINLNTLTVDINGKKYSENSENRFRYEGNTLKYTIFIDPKEDLPEKTPITVKINGQDIDGNAIQEKNIYTFNALMPVEACEYKIYPGLPDLRPSATAVDGGNVILSKAKDLFLLILLLLLALTLTYCFYLKRKLNGSKEKITKNKQKKIKKRSKKVGKTKKKISKK